MELIKSQNGKLLRCGYTTGTCAAAAAKAAASMLLTGDEVRSVSLTTPNGVVLTLDVHDIRQSGDFVQCAIKKDSGDDPDVTNGMLVYAQIRRIPSGISIDGGAGVGRVTKPGLDQPVGAAAINSTPRNMIAEAVQTVCRKSGYGGGMSVIVSIPGGEAVARRTFNPRMGIEGGLSVIGTTGIVEPMSSRAMIDTMRLQIRQLSTAGATDVFFTPGNYGAAFARDVLRLSMERQITCSNYIGDAIDAALESGFRRILLVGHIGKLVKLGIGITNTHSSFGDGRMETLTACALESGGDISLLQGVMECATTNAALDLIYRAGLLPKTMSVLGARIDACLARRIPEDVMLGYVCFTNAGPFAGVLTQSENAPALCGIWR